MPKTDEEYIKKMATLIILIILIILTYLLLKPILLSIILGVILAFIFSPVYNLILRLVRFKSLSAAIVCLIFAAMIILPIWFLTPIAINQSLKVYLVLQEVDFITPLKDFFPSIFASDEFSVEIGNIIKVFLTKIAGYVVGFFSSLILNFATFALQLLVVFFTFFFVLRDKELVINYVKSLMPFSSEVEKKLFVYSRGITSSVIYGQIIVGLIQGSLVGIGFFVARVPNALFLTLIAATTAILPIIGPFLVWVPVAIYLFAGGNTNQAIVVVVFGLIASLIDNFLRPIITSRATRMHSALVLIGMISGLFMFGILGFILGPLILAYLFILLEAYRKKPIQGVFIQGEEKQNKIL